MVSARALARRVRAAVASRRTLREGNRPSLAEVQGFSLELPTHFRYHYVDHDYEPLSRAFMLEHIQPGDRVADVGAHIGLYTLLMARAVGPSGRVVAVEPVAENIHYLEANVGGNGFDDRVEVVAAAATDVTGTVSFHITGSSDSHGLHPHPNTPTARVVTVPAVRLDEVVGPIQFLKVDTEGAEIATLAGASGVIRADGRRAALIEWAPQCQKSAGYGLTDLPTALADLGYELRVLDDKAGWDRSVDEVVSDLTSGTLDDGWYGNIACVRPA